MIPQQTLAHYRIVSKLGVGGMGEVWRATDTKLGRDVAIKILPEAFASDSERLARFTREAQVLASLNHPNIAAVYGVEDRALVMEPVPLRAQRRRNLFRFQSGRGWKHALSYVPLERGKPKAIVTLPRVPVMGLAVSPDGGSLLYSRAEQVSQELALVENFQ